ncbi:hypothetical protein LGK95_18360 [Clostridium algoriphilum]|uniref:hypothetical protein n=1 Tax=Clostridium algoriphilum TaxID=198347 RepID=UPI001CF26BDE|nr:hypothetical protein [Clostridium algoriphilum]MCB2295449.1 hypothetical protein [Clostridium algoriphilum]
MNKKISFINPTTICMVICAIFLFNVFYKTYEYSPNDPIGAVGGRLLLGVTGAIVGAIMGLILTFIAHLFFKPSRTNRLLKEQNNILYNNNCNKNNKIEELNKLTELKKSGTLSEEEFKKLKNKILNKR